MGSERGWGVRGEGGSGREGGKGGGGVGREGGEWEGGWGVREGGK